MTRVRRMHTALLVAAGALLWAGVAEAQNANHLTAGEKAEGWQLLFDGQDLKGWDARSTSTPGANGSWRVENGAILCPGSSAGWLATGETFTDFHLKLQFQGAEKVNSGVFLRSQKEGQPHVTGFELQIWDYQPAGYDTGSLVGATKAKPTKIRPDQWNDYDITVDGDHYLIVLNGTTLLDTHNTSHASGVIGFQCQPNNRIEFRDVRVLPLHR